MKWFLIKNQEIQLCSQQMLTKTHKVIANQIKIQHAIIYHYTHMMKIISSPTNSQISLRHSYQMDFK